MVKHIVFWKLKENAHNNTKEENARLIKEKLESIRCQIDGLLHIEVGINFLEGVGNYDVVLYSELESAEALKAYAEHPKHVAFLPFVKEAVADRKAVDYEL